MKTEPSHRRRFNAETQRRRGAELSHRRNHEDTKTRRMSPNHPPVARSRQAGCPPHNGASPIVEQASSLLFFERSAPAVTLSEGVLRPTSMLPSGSARRCFLQRHSELRGILRLASLAQNDRFLGTAVVTRRSICDGCDEYDGTLNYQLLTVNLRWCDVSAPLHLCASALSLRWRDGCDETLNSQLSTCSVFVPTSCLRAFVVATNRG